MNRNTVNNRDFKLNSFRAGSVVNMAYITTCVFNSRWLNYEYAPSGMSPLRINYGISTTNWLSIPRVHRWWISTLRNTRQHYCFSFAHWGWIHALIYAGWLWIPMLWKNKKYLSNNNKNILILALEVFSSQCFFSTWNNINKSTLKRKKN